jgi:hypothetical protein
MSYIFFLVCKYFTAEWNVKFYRRGRRRSVVKHIFYLEIHGFRFPKRGRVRILFYNSSLRV